MAFHRNALQYDREWRDPHAFRTFMNNTDQIKMFLSFFALSLPTLMVCFVAGLVILAKWRQASRASLWALLGFGLTTFLCFAMPVAQTMLQQWVFQTGERESRMWAFTAFSIIGSVLHAVIYAFLLVAIFAGRSKTDVAYTVMESPAT